MKKDADQLRSNCKADQCLFFRYMDSAIPLLTKSEISGLFSVAVRPIFYGCMTDLVGKPENSFLTTRLI